MPKHEILKEKNNRIKPFELSLWRDELVTKNFDKENQAVIENEKFLDIYKGIGTDKDDLSFWYRPRIENGGKITPVDSHIATIKIDPPEKREKDLVHIDFSTSNLIFKPNTYYTFYTRLTFLKDGANKVLSPDLEKYKDNTGKIEHILLSLVCNNVEESIWDMPHPIFDTKLGIKTQINSKKETQFFLVNNNLQEGEANRLFRQNNNLFLLGRLKTNNFIKENYTLGMWSYIESWLGDYWEGEIEIHVVEDNEEVEETGKGVVFNAIEEYFSSTEINLLESPEIFPVGANEVDEGIEFAKTCLKEDFVVPSGDQSSNMENQSIKPFTEYGSYSQILVEIEQFFSNYLNEMALTIKNYFEQMTEQNLDEMAEQNLDEIELEKFVAQEETSSEKMEEYTLQIRESLNSCFYPYQNDNENNDIFNILEGIEFDLNIDNCPYLKKENNEYKLYWNENDNEGETITAEIDELLSKERVDNILEIYWEGFFNTQPDTQLKENIIFNNIINLLENQELSTNENKIIENNKLIFDNVKKWDNIGRILLNNENLRNYYYDLYLMNDNDIEKRQRQESYRAVNHRGALQFIILLALKREVSIISNILSDNEDGTNDTLWLRNIKRRLAWPSRARKGYITLKDYTDDLIELRNNFSFSYIGNTATNTTRENFSKFSSFKERQQELQEKKYLIFGSNNGPKSYAQEIVLNENTKDSVNTLTFSMYNAYYSDWGTKEKNPYVNLLQNESKIKLKYDGNWYDFIITDIELDRENNKINYTAKDANIIELSKIGFNKEFNSELDNNIGTLNELAESVLHGTDWVLDTEKTEKFIQHALKPVFGGYLNDGYSIIINPKETFYDNKLTRRPLDVETNLDDGAYIKICSGSFIYMFYDSTDQERPTLICPAWDLSYRERKPIILNYTQEQYLKIDNKLINVFLCPNYKILFNEEELQDIGKKEYEIEGFSQTKINTLDIFNNKIYFDYTLRAKDIVIKPKTHYSVPLKRYVTEYEDVENNQILYGYVESEYSTKPLVQNLLPNGKNFTSLDGWYCGILNNRYNIDGALGCGEKTENEQEVFSPFLSFSTSTVGFDKNKYARTDFGKKFLNRYHPHGFICNTSLGYNFSALDHLTPGDEFVLQIQVERGGNFLNTDSSDGAYYSAPNDLLYFLESMTPSLYFYDGTYAFENKNINNESGNEYFAKNILPEKKDQVLHFIQDKRFIDMSKYASGLINKKTWSDTNGSTHSTSTFSDLDSTDKVIYNLNSLINNGQLVPIYYYHSREITENEEKKHYKVLDKYPLAFVLRERAKRWANREDPLVKTFLNVGLINPPENVFIREGGSIVDTLSDSRARDYIFTEKGWNSFRSLFVQGGVQNSDNINLKDLAIVGIPQSSTKGRTWTETCNSSMVYLKGQGSEGEANFGVGAFRWFAPRSIHYYLPMLFSDEDIVKEIENFKNDEEDLKGVMHNTFFKNAYSTVHNEIYYNYNWEYETILKKKEYYKLWITSSKSGAVYPQNITIDFDENNYDSKVSVKALELEDFLHIIRMREFWYLKKYSKMGTCVFETTGTFYGRPIKDQNTNGQVSWSYSNKISGYNYEDLIEKNLGLFFTIGYTRIDNTPRGGDDTHNISISEISLFRKYLDSNGELILPESLVESNSTPIYKLYDPSINKDIILPEDIQYTYIGTSLNNEKYKIILDETGERKNSITATESNCLNLLQKLAETFEAWLVIFTEHDDQGYILFDENHKPKKKIYFINMNYNDNYSGIRYGLNLKKIQRTIDSNDIVTKLIVKNNNNEFAQNKFCSIARSEYNFNGSNSIYNLNYLIQNGLLPISIKENYFQQVCPRTYNYGVFLKEMNSKRSIQLTKKAQIEAQKEYYKNLINTAKQKFSENLQDYGSYKHIIVENGEEIREPYRSYFYYLKHKEDFAKLPDEIKKTIISLNFYNNLVKGFEQEYKKASSDFTTALRQYNSYVDLAKGVTEQRDYLLKEFEELCRGYIREGAWSSEDYIDDDLYYLDSERQAEEVSKPKVTYTIDTVDISSLPGYENYNYKLRDKTFVEDPEIFGYDAKRRPFKEEIIVTEKTSYLQSPENNTITMQNYQTGFDDLFQRMASTIQAVEFGTLNYPNRNSSKSLEARISNNESTTIALKAINGIY